MNVKEEGLQSGEMGGGLALEFVQGGGLHFSFSSRSGAQQTLRPETPWKSFPDPEGGLSQPKRRNIGQEYFVTILNII